MMDEITSEKSQTINPIEKKESVSTQPVANRKDFQVESLSQKQEHAKLVEMSSGPEKDKSSHRDVLFQEKLTKATNPKAQSLKKEKACAKTRFDVDQCLAKLHRVRDERSLAQFWAHLRVQSFLQGMQFVKKRMAENHDFAKIDLERLSSLESLIKEFKPKNTSSFSQEIINKMKQAKRQDEDNTTEINCASCKAFLTMQVKQMCTEATIEERESYPIYTLKKSERFIKVEEAPKSKPKTRAFDVQAGINEMTNRFVDWLKSIIKAMKMPEAESIEMVKLTKLKQ